MRCKTLLFWSSGKDSAWMLHMLRQHPDIEIAGLITTFNSTTNRVAMHGVRMELVRTQAASAQLPLLEIALPWPCSNSDYELRMRQVIDHARAEHVEAFAFGDLHLSDIRAYREQQLSGTEITPLFPLWGDYSATPELARTMITAGLRATITCIDPRQLDPAFLGREFDSPLLHKLPPSVDPCGERGEFHTFCHTGPMFQTPIPYLPGETGVRDGFHYIDLKIAP